MANLQSSDTRWDDIRIFLAIHRHHTLAAAAGKLAIDTSTVSRRLAALEADLGHPLFERTRTGLQPTAAAGRVLAAAEAMEAAHARMTREASEVETTAEGIVRISTAPGLSSVFVAPMLVRLRKLYPRISIELDAAVAARDLTRHEADLAIRSVRSQGAELVTTKLVTASWVAAAAKPVAAKLGTLTAWSAAPWITWDRDLASFPATRWVAAHVEPRSIALRTSDFPAQLNAAASGLGVVLAPVPYLERANLVPVRFAPGLAKAAEAWPADDLWLVGHRALREVPRVAAVWSFLVDELRRD
ncbi:MAG: LysR family transcriptional regulator [Myxococcales bacterium]|nr:LysR family transcriptional regulator [Myxococcales bacterium]